MKSIVLTSLLAATASVALAQQAPAPQPYARVVSMEGTVTVSSGSQMTSASKDMALARGAQVVTSGNGKVTIRFSNGCEASLNAGQSFDVQESQCAALLARSQAPVTVPVVDPLRNPALITWGAALGAVVLSKNKVSGS